MKLHYVLGKYDTIPLTKLRKSEDSLLYEHNYCVCWLLSMQPLLHYMVMPQAISGFINAAKVPVCAFSTNTKHHIAGPLFPFSGKSLNDIQLWVCIIHLYLKYCGD